MSFRKVAEPEDKPSVAGPRLCEESESRVAPLPSDPKSSSPSRIAVIGNYLPRQCGIVYVFFGSIQHGRVSPPGHCFKGGHTHDPTLIVRCFGRGSCGCRVGTSDKNVHGCSSHGRGVIFRGGLHSHPPHNRRLGCIQYPLRIRAAPSALGI